MGARIAVPGAAERVVEGLAARAAVGQVVDAAHAQVAAHRPHRLWRRRRRRPAHRRRRLQRERRARPARRASWARRAASPRARRRGAPPRRASSTPARERGESSAGEGERHAAARRRRRAAAWSSRLRADAFEGLRMAERSRARGLGRLGLGRRCIERPARGGADDEAREEREREDDGILHGTAASEEKPSRVLVAGGSSHESRCADTRCSASAAPTLALPALPRIHYGCVLERRDARQNYERARPVPCIGVVIDCIMDATVFASRSTTSRASTSSRPSRRPRRCRASAKSSTALARKFVTAHRAAARRRVLADGRRPERRAASALLLPAAPARPRRDIPRFRGAINLWWVKRRGLMMGIAGAAATTGISALVPVLLQHSLAAIGWRQTYFVLGSVSAFADGAASGPSSAHGEPPARGPTAAGARRSWRTTAPPRRPRAATGRA